MPTVLRIGPYRFGFYSKENSEPPHVHVTHGRSTAKYWLDPAVVLATSRGFGGHELTVVRRLIEANRPRLLEAWHDHFDEADAD